MNSSEKKFEITLFNGTFVKEMAENETVCLGEEAWTENGITDTANRNGTYFVAVKSGEYIGHGGFTTVLDECYITNIAVSPKHRRKGVGTAILLKMIDDCKQKNAAFLTLEVRDSNKAAISLYEKYGFEVSGRRKNFYSDPKEDAIIMTLTFR
jgi:ribosomal-protein-alanine N-acetyltransferase